LEGNRKIFEALDLGKRQAMFGLAIFQLLFRINVPSESTL
jgi:hypothetical protein